MTGIWFRIALFVGLLSPAVCCNGAANADTLVLRGGSVYASPDAAPGSPLPRRRKVLVDSQAIWRPTRTSVTTSNA